MTRRWELKKISVIMGILGLYLSLFQSVDLVSAKDPEYPSKPITHYIPFGAGGGTDLAARAIIGTAAKHLGQPFVPINKGGAGGALAATAILNAKPDGYTLGSTPAGFAFTLPFTDPAPYKDLSGFTFICNYGKIIFPLMVRGDAPWKTWKELMDWARKNPKGVKVGITGSREVTVQGYALMNIEKRENVELTYMPHKSSAEVLSAVLGGHITLYAAGVDAATMPYVEEGKLRILGFMDPKAEKLRGYESLPSTEELYGISIPKAIGIVGPKGLPEYVLKKLDDAFAKAVKDPDFIKVMDRCFLPVVYLNRAQMTRHMEELYRQGGEFVEMLKAERAKERK